MTPSAASKGRVRVGATDDGPELVETLPITLPGERRDWRVVMRLGPDSESDDPMPDLRPGDKLRAYAELVVAPDGPGAAGPAAIGGDDLDPEIEARFLLTNRRDEVWPRPPDSLLLGRWTGTSSHSRDRQVVALAGGEVTVPQGFSGDAYVNVVVSATHPGAQLGDRIRVGQSRYLNGARSIGGIRVVRLRPAHQPVSAPIRHSELASPEVAVAERDTVVMSMPVDGLKAHEQLEVRGRLVADAAGLDHDAQLTARMFLADDPTAVEPNGRVADVASASGRLSHDNGSAWLAHGRSRALEKYGVLRIKQDAPSRLYVNLVATGSPAADGGDAAAERLPIRRGTFLELIRYRPELFG